MNNMNKIILFNKACIYNKEKNKTIIFGQYNTNFQNIILSQDINYNIIHCIRKGKHFRGKAYNNRKSNNRQDFDFYLELDERIEFINTIIFEYKNNEKENIIFENIDLIFPFDLCSLCLNSDSAIIVTMCKCFNDSYRLYEWIEYNLNLGFSAIIIFNNDDNPDKFDKQSVYNKYNKQYKQRIFILDFDYKPIPCIHWNSIQKVAFNIGVNALINKCSKIALIDTDEFIYIPKDPYINIEKFLLQFPKQTIAIRSHLLTNKGVNNKINNNVLDIPLYTDPTKNWTKVIIDNVMLKKQQKENGLFFNNTSHHMQPNQLILGIDKIFYFHIWLNKRTIHRNHFEESSLLKDLKYNFKS